LEKIIDENIIEEVEPENQGDENICWQYALSTVIYLATARVFGRKLEKFEEIRKKVAMIKNEIYKGSIKRSNFLKIAQRIVGHKYFKLRAQKIENPDQARKAVMEGRPCLCFFSLMKESWETFKNFFNNKENSKSILTKDIIRRNNNGRKKGRIGHAVVFISIEDNCLKFLNSYGKDWGDNGYFRVENEEVLDNLTFFDIFWDEKDLTEEEKKTYNNYLSYIKQTSILLSKPNFDMNEEMKKKVECPKCKEQLLLENFEIETDQRNLKIKCLKCQNIFESGDIMALLYLYNLFN
jgi:hypothetical protein